MKKKIVMFLLLIGFIGTSAYACPMRNQYNSGKPVASKSEAEKLSLSYLSTIDDRNIKIESINDKVDYYVVVVINDESERVAELIVDKKTGTVRPNF